MTKRKNRSMPVRLSDASFSWKVATVVLSPLGGLCYASQTVTLICATSGANIHYTTSGLDPTATDPFVAVRSEDDHCRIS